MFLGAYGAWGMNIILIYIDKSIPPVQHVPRRVPMAMKIKQKLAELTKQGRLRSPLPGSATWWQLGSLGNFSYV